MSKVIVRDSTQLVISDRNFADLCFEIATHFKSNPHKEDLIDDVIVVWDNNEGKYIATIYMRKENEE